MFEAQAILDLYLAEMRRIEDAEGRVVPSWRDKTESSTLRIPTNCRVRRCGHYPRLVLEGFDCRNKDKAKQRSAYTRRRPRMDSASGYWTDEGDAYSDEEDEWTDEDEEDSEDGEGERKTFTITLEQVNTHLARRGTSHDHLDHPLLVARSGLQALTMSRGGVPLVVHGDYPDEERAGFYDWDDPTDDDDSEHEGRHLRYAEEDDYLSEAERAELFPPRPSPPPLSPSTAGLPNGPLDPKRRSDIITLGRSVIHLARNLQNLSLTGYMYRCAHRKPHGLQNLRSLCLGPLTPSEQAAQCLAKVKLPSLRRLRVCGGNLCAVAAEVIGSPGGKLPQLRDVEWDYGALRLTHRRGYQRGQL